MTLLETLSSQLPCRYYLGIDIGYKEHVAVVIPLETFVGGGERWKRARCVHFASIQTGLRKLQRYLDCFATEHSDFFGLCEPTGGHYGAATFQYLLEVSKRHSDPVKTFETCVHNDRSSVRLEIIIKAEHPLVQGVQLLNKRVKFETNDFFGLNEGFC